MKLYRKKRRDTVRLSVELPLAIVEALDVMSKADGIYPGRTDVYLSHFVCRAVAAFTSGGAYNPDTTSCGEPVEVPSSARFPNVYDFRCRAPLSRSRRPFWLLPVPTHSKGEKSGVTRLT